MKTIEKCLLARRTTDGQFLSLHESQHTTTHGFVDDPALAKRIPLNGYSPEHEQLTNIQPAAYYFENSHRARNRWTLDCEMVPYEVTTEVTIVPISVGE